MAYFFPMVGKTLYVLRDQYVSASSLPHLSFSPITLIPALQIGAEDGTKVDLVCFIAITGFRHLQHLNSCPFLD